MFDNPEVVRIVRQWVGKAENDLTNATHALKLGRRCPTDTVCFHAQQCIEKYLKALLAWRGKDFPRTHHLTALIAQLDASDRPDLTSEEQFAFTEYATVTRYPGDYDPLTLTQAREAVRVARRARRQIRLRLPAAALKAG